MKQYALKMIFQTITGYLDPQVLYANSKKAKMRDKNTITAKNIIGVTKKKTDKQ